MAEITEALERLVSLRDRGVLTQEEFDQQKAMLLNPPAEAPAPVATPMSPPPIAPVSAYPASAYGAAPGGGNKTALFAVGGLVLVVAIVAALWATGVLAKMGIGSAPFGDSSSSTIAGNSPFGTSNGAAANPFGVTPSVPMAPPAPAAAPAYSDSSMNATTPASANPALGTWTGVGNVSDDCPQTMTFADNVLTMQLVKNGVPQSKVAGVTYTVVGSSVTMALTGGQATTLTANFEGNQMTLDGCHFSRAN